MNKPCHYCKTELKDDETTTVILVGFSIVRIVFICNDCAENVTEIVEREEVDREYKPEIID